MVLVNIVLIRHARLSRLGLKSFGLRSRANDFLFIKVAIFTQLRTLSVEHVQDCITWSCTCVIIIIIINHNYVNLDFNFCIICTVLEKIGLTGATGRIKEIPV